MDKQLELSEKEINEIIRTIAEPVFRYVMKRIQNKILLDKKRGTMSMNSFLSVFVASMASVDANLFRWAENFYHMKTNQPIDFDKLKITYFKNLNEQLKVILQ